MPDVFDSLDGPPKWWRGKPEHWPSPEKRRAVREEMVRARKARALSRWYVKLSWHELAGAMQALSTDRATRLWLLVKWQDRVEKPDDGWLLPKRQLLASLELVGPNYGIVVNRLEERGLIEVQRRPGKQPWLRLINKPPLRLVEISKKD